MSVDYTCPNGGLKCKDNLQCIRYYDICDESNDCNDNSDEDPAFCRGTKLRICNEININ